MSYRYADTRWMRGSFGVSFHWTAQTVRQAGPLSPWSDAVADFDPDALADALVEFKRKLVEKIAAKDAAFQTKLQ